MLANVSVHDLQIPESPGFHYCVGVELQEDPQEAWSWVPRLYSHS